MAPLTFEMRGLPVSKTAQHWLCQMATTLPSLGAVETKTSRHIRDARVARVKDGSALVMSDDHDAPVSGAVETKTSRHCVLALSR